MIRDKITQHPRLHWFVNDVRSWLAPFLNVPFGVGAAPISNDIPFLFVVGAGRSGNTLFRRLLMERFQIYIPPETYVLPKVADYRIRCRGLAWPSFVDLVIASFEYHPEFETFELGSLSEFAAEAKRYPEEEKNATSLLTGLYKYFAVRRQIDFQWLGDKTPLNTLHLGRIGRLFPRARYVYLLRDGVDVTASYLRAGIYRNLEDAALRGIKSQRSWEGFREHLSRDRYIEVRYEDMVANPGEVMASVGRGLGIPERISGMNVGHALGDVGKRPHHENTMKSPSLSSIGKGRKELTETEKDRLRPILSGWLKHCHYPSL